jgi:translation initiation factor 3 subunit C
MSRFWAAGGASDSDSESDGSSSFYSSDNSSKGGRGGDGNRWVAMSESDSSESGPRVVKSGKERALETFQNLIKTLRTAMKERNYYDIQVEFDKLMRAMEKAKQYLAEGVPRPLVRILVDLEDYITERLKDKAQFKKLSARQGRSLNRMKLTLKKHNKAYQVVIDAYRENPVVSSSDDESAKSSSSSSSSSSGGSKKKDASEKKGSDDDVSLGFCNGFAVYHNDSRNDSSFPTRHVLLLTKRQNTLCMRLTSSSHLFRFLFE